MKKILLQALYTLFCVSSPAQITISPSNFDVDTVIGYVFTSTEEMHNIALVTVRNDTVYIADTLFVGDKIYVEEKPSALLYCPCPRSVSAILPVVTSRNYANVINHFTVATLENIDGVVIDSLRAPIRVYRKGSSVRIGYYLSHIINDNYSLVIITPQ